MLTVAAELPLPPEQVWDFLSQPEHRKFLAGTPRHTVTNLAHGRIGAGSVYQCYHGDHLIPQTVLEWQPFERVVTQDLMPIPVPDTYTLIEYRLVATDTGTRLSQTFFQASGPWLGRKMLPLALRSMAKQAQADMDSFKQHVEEMIAGREPGSGAASGAAAA
jgi:uncharacterized protein YndB with AHSA1/START domain